LKVLCVNAYFDERKRESKKRDCEQDDSVELESVAVAEQ
jgi:hypothetical protein